MQSKNVKLQILSKMHGTGYVYKEPPFSQTNFPGPSTLHYIRVPLYQQIKDEGKILKYISCNLSDLIKSKISISTIIFRVNKAGVQ